MTDETPQVILPTVPARIRGKYRYLFRPGEIAEIIGVRLTILKHGGYRPCFMVLFHDGVIDYWPIEDEANHEIVP